MSIWACNFVVQARTMAYMCFAVVAAAAAAVVVGYKSIAADVVVVVAGVRNWLLCSWESSSQH